MDTLLQASGIVPTNWLREISLDLYRWELTLDFLGLHFDLWFGSADGHSFGCVCVVSEEVAADYTFDLVPRLLIRFKNRQAGILGPLLINLNLSGGVLKKA